MIASVIRVAMIMMCLAAMLAAHAGSATDYLLGVVVLAATGIEASSLVRHR